MTAGHRSRAPDDIVDALDGLLFPLVLDQPRPSPPGLREVVMDQTAALLEAAR